MEYVYLNGAILPAGEARISVFDAGMTHAAGLFETLRTYNRHVMRLGDHIDRLARSAATLEMQVNVDQQDVQDGIDRLLDAQGLDDARIRIVVTPGSIPRPGNDGMPATGTTLLITATPVQAYTAELYRHGMRVCISPYRQNRLDPIAGHKTLAYLPRLLAIKEAAERQCHEALWFTTENLLAEGSVCNVFIAKNGKIATPPLDTPILPGTVRKAVIEIALAANIELEEKPIDINALFDAEEVFLTGSVLEIMPVTAIEKHVVGPGTVGQVVKQLRERYAELVAKECNIER